MEIKVGDIYMHTRGTLVVVLAIGVPSVMYFGPMVLVEDLSTGELLPFSMSESWENWFCVGAWDFHENVAEVEGDDGVYYYDHEDLLEWAGKREQP